jgi:hypothetical protein
VGDTRRFKSCSRSIALDTLPRLHALCAVNTAESCSRAQSDWHGDRPHDARNIRLLHFPLVKTCREVPEQLFYPLCVPALQCDERAIQAFCGSVPRRRGIPAQQTGSTARMWACEANSRSGLVCRRSNMPVRILRR